MVAKARAEVLFMDESRFHLSSSDGRIRIWRQGGSQARSVDDHPTYDFHIDPVSKRLVRDRKSADRKSQDRKASRAEKPPEFVIKPRRQFLDEGETAKFKASFDGSPGTKLQWSKNGVEISTDSKHKVYQEKELHWLEISNVSSQDGGTYTCTIQNEAGSIQAPAELEVLVKPKPSTKKGLLAPQVDVSLKDLSVSKDERNVQLECKFTNAIDATAVWFRDGRKLNSGFFTKQTFDGRLARLTLNKVSDKELGVYECVVTNTGGEAKTKAQLFFTVPGARSIPPKFVLPLSNQKLTAGETLVLQSDLTGYPKPSVKWYKNREELHETKSLTMEYNGSTVKLMLFNVQTSDSDSYKCVAENEAGRDQIKATVSVIAPASVAPDDFKEPPVFVKELQDMEANDGDKVELVVQVAGTPPIDVVWLHKEREINYDDPVFKMTREGSVHRLIIPEALPEDTGQFVCEAYNDYGDTDTFCALTVREIVSEKCMHHNKFTNLDIDSTKYVHPTNFESESDVSLQYSDSGYTTEKSMQKPDFVLKPHSVEVQSGGSALFLCRITGSPFPNVQWEKQGKAINNDARHKITFGEDCILEIKDVTPSDNGIYTCILTNPAGVITVDTTLVVKEHYSTKMFNLADSRVSSQNILREKIPVYKDHIVEGTSQKHFQSSGFSKPVQSTSLIQPEKMQPKEAYNSFYGRIEKLNKLDQKPPKRPQNFVDFRSVLKSKPESPLENDKTLKSIPDSKYGKSSFKSDSDGSEGIEDFRNILTQRKQSREEVMKTQSDKKSNSFSGPSSKKDNSVTPMDYNSVLGRKRNSFPRDTSPLFNKENEINKYSNRNVPAEKDVFVKSEVNKFNSSPSQKVFDNKFSNDVIKQGNSHLNENISKNKFDFAQQKDIQTVTPQKKSYLDSQESRGHSSRQNKTPHNVPKTESHVTEKVATVQTNAPVLTDIMDEADIEKLLAKRRERRRPSPAYQEHPKEDKIIIPVLTNDSENSLSRNATLQKETMKDLNISAKSENSVDVKRNVFRNGQEKTSENVHTKEKNDSSNSASKVILSSQDKQSKLSTAFSPPDLVSNDNEDFRTILASRKARNLIQNSSDNDVLVEECKVQQNDNSMSNDDANQRTLKNCVGIQNGDPETEIKSNRVAQEKVKIVEEKVKNRPPLKLNLKRQENLQQNGSIKTPEEYNSDDFRSILSRRRRSSNSLNKVDSKLNSPGAQNQTDFRHLLTRHVETRHRQPPAFNTRLKDKFVKEGESVTMECHVTGVPKPAITWTANNTQIKPSKFFRMTYDENSIARLVIAGAYPEDDGVYVCTATNSSGSETTTCHLFVKESCSAASNDQSEEDFTVETPHKSELSKDMEDTTEEEDPSDTPTLVAPCIHEINPSVNNSLRGQKVTIQASFTSDEKPVIQWHKGKKLLQNDQSVTISTTEHFSRLTIHDIQPNDAGKYQITVENSVGNVSAVSSVNVQDVPDKPAGRPYASDVTLRSVILSWGGPAYDGGSQVTGYRVEICEAENEVWRVLSDNCHSTSYHVGNLVPHTPYFFRISAKNKFGYGKPSEASAVIVTKDRRNSMRLSVDSDDVFVTSPTSPTGSFMSIFSPTEEDLPFDPRIVSLEQGRSFEDHYDLKDTVGKGKFGKVNKCVEKVSGKTFAAKIVKCRSQKERENMRQELEIMNLLTHPKLLMLWDAFEMARSFVLVMEYVAGGELFDRVADEDLELTERDCVHFVRQICQGVQYMHTKSILHLDLKPENILCVHKDNNLIKIIDFGLARRHKEGESLRVMFGTPEFIAPEVVNYEEIGFPTDIWSVGVICYVLLSGLSPFMGDSDVETLSNVTRGEYDFDDEAFDEISETAKDFINSTLKLHKKKRLTIDQCLDHNWLAKAERNSSKKLRQSLRNLKQFMARRKWQKMGNAIRAVGRMSLLQKTRSGSDSSTHSDSDVSSQSDLSSFSSRPSSLGSEDRNHKQTLPSENNSSPPSKNVFNKPVQSEQLPNPSHENKNCIDNSGTKDGHHQGQSELTFVKKTVDCEAFIGDIARFDVQIQGHLSPSVQWYYRGEIIHNDNQHSIIDELAENGEFSLIIKNVCDRNEGKYTCKINDGFHQIKCKSELIILRSGAF